MRVVKNIWTEANLAQSRFQCLQAIFVGFELPYTCCPYFKRDSVLAVQYITICNRTSFSLMLASPKITNVPLYIAADFFQIFTACWFSRAKILPIYLPHESQASHLLKCSPFSR